MCYTMNVSLFSLGCLIWIVDILSILGPRKAAFNHTPGFQGRLMYESWAWTIRACSYPGGTVMITLPPVCIKGILQLGSREPIFHRFIIPSAFHVKGYKCYLFRKDDYTCENHFAQGNGACSTCAKNQEWFDGRARDRTI